MCCCIIPTANLPNTPVSNPLGAVLGGLVIGITEALAVVGLSSGYKDVVALAIMVAMMIMMPNGILGRAGRRGG